MSWWLFIPAPVLPLLQRRESLEFRSIAGINEGTYALTDDTAWHVMYHDGQNFAQEGLVLEQEQSSNSGSKGREFDRDALDFVYPHRTASLTPTKLTATQLKGREKDDEIAENTPRPYVRSSFAAPRFLTGELPVTADQRGTATHLVMQYLSLDGDAAETIRDLATRHLLNAEQAASVDIASINRFLDSKLADELRAADRIEREYRFSLLVDAQDYYDGVSAEDQVLLQGVVDLFAETESGVTVVDFKTDYVTEETIGDKIAYYRPQIEAYSTALQLILEKPVVRRVLYFFHTGQAIEL